MELLNTELIKEPIVIKTTKVEYRLKDVYILKTYDESLTDDSLYIVEKGEEPTKLLYEYEHAGRLTKIDVIYSNVYRKTKSGDICFYMDGQPKHIFVQTNSTTKFNIVTLGRSLHR